MSAVTRATRLKKELGLFDVFAISTGAMFSSGFFLLPGLAYAKTGMSVVLAYLCAGVLILPAMFSKAELSTALPRAGGTYFFLDRALGPLAGTIGGLGTYFALTLKTAFALFGIGAYAALFLDLPIKPVALALTAVFVGLNVAGAKETTAVQRWLVITLLVILALFVVLGGMYLLGRAPDNATAAAAAPAQPFFAGGLAGFFSTIGFVFVSYAGLTKVASVAEEVKNPDRNIPLGMMLSLGVTALVYSVGVLMIVSLVDASVLASDLTPVASATAVAGAWLPGRLAVLLIVVAAMAAFASTGNAGLMSASRYPFAMARDRLLPSDLATLGRFRTPTASILLTGTLMVGFIVFLDAENLAKLASAFTLFIFVFVNVSVIVMRESGIPSYDPGYRSPWYPSMQILGIVSSVLLIIAMGWQAVIFITAVSLACVAWYVLYASSRVERHGAIYHWFARLGQRQTSRLDTEFRGILKEKGLRANDPYEDIVARSVVLDVRRAMSFEQLMSLASDQFALHVSIPANEIAARFLDGTRQGHTPVTEDVALPHFRLPGIDCAHLVVIRGKKPIFIPVDASRPDDNEFPHQSVHTIFCLISPEHDPAQHLRILAEIAVRVDAPGFAQAWAAASSRHELREVLLQDHREGVATMMTSSVETERHTTPVTRPTTAAPSDSGLLEQLLGLLASPEFMAELRGVSDDIELPALSTLPHATQVDLAERLHRLAARPELLDSGRQREIDAALGRLEDGHYGFCTACGKPMEAMWLRLRPDAQACLDCHAMLHWQSGIYDAPVA